jgi:hypothetical protein
MAKAFTPTTGWNDTAVFLDEPVDPRGDLQKLHTQMLGFHNELLADYTSHKAEYANVKSYGAKGDGITDDTTVIQVAFDTGKPVYFPTGTYLISSKLIYKFPSQSLKGDGYYNSIIKASGTYTDDCLMEMRGDYVSPAYRSGQSIEGLGFDGNNKCDGISPILNADWKIKACKIYNCNNGLNIVDSLIYEISDCTIIYNDIGIYFAGTTALSPSNLSLFNFCRIIGNNVAISCDAGKDVGANIVFYGCEIEANGQNETLSRPTVYVKSTTGVGTNNIMTFRNCWVENNSNPKTFHIDIASPLFVLFDNCTTLSLANTQTHMIYAEGSGTIIVNNCIDNSQYTAYTLEAIETIKVIAYVYSFQSISVADIADSIIHDTAQSRYITDFKLYGSKLKLRAVAGSGYSDIYNYQNDLFLEAVTGNLEMTIPANKYWGSATSADYTRPFRIGLLWLWAAGQSLYMKYGTAPANAADGVVVATYP